MVQCIDCLRAGQREKAPPAMAQLGYARCALERSPGVYMPLDREHDCESFVEAQPAVAQQRRDWLTGVDARLRQASEERARGG